MFSEEEWSDMIDKIEGLLQDAEHDAIIESDEIKALGSLIIAKHALDRLIEKFLGDRPVGRVTCPECGSNHVVKAGEEK